MVDIIACIYYLLEKMANIINPSLVQTVAERLDISMDSDLFINTIYLEYRFYLINLKVFLENKSGRKNKVKMLTCWHSNDSWLMFKHNWKTTFKGFSSGKNIRKNFKIKTWSINFEIPKIMEFTWINLRVKPPVAHIDKVNYICY